MNAYKSIVAGVVFVSALLAGCGGGGGATVSVATFPLDTGAQSFLTSSHHFTANYTDPAKGDLYTLVYSYTPGADASFEGQAAKTANLVLNLKKNNTQQLSSSEVIYFQTGPVKFLGATGSGEYIVAANQVPFPVSGKVGDSGSLDTKISYSDSSKTVINGTEVDTWVLQPADSATTAYLCLKTSITDSHGFTLSGAECYKINTDGTVLGNKITVTVNGLSITFSS